MRTTLQGAALSLLAALVAHLPERGARWLGTAVGFVAGSLLRVRRSQVEASLARAGVGSPAVVAAAMYRRLGHGIVDLLRIAGAPPGLPVERIAAVVITPEALAALEAGLARGPVVLFGSHTGNWELAAAAAGVFLRARGRTIAIVAKPMHARGVDAFLARLRARLGVGVIAPRGALAAARRDLLAGGVVVLPIDQVPDRATHGRWVRFLGAPALVDRAPATLAWRSRATALVVASRTDDDGVERVHLLEAIPPPTAEDRAAAWIAGTTALATARLEAFVAESPASWMWLHRRWRQARRRDPKAPGSATLVPSERAS